MENQVQRHAGQGRMAETKAYEACKSILSGSFNIGNQGSGQDALAWVLRYTPSLLHRLTVRTSGSDLCS